MIYKLLVIYLIIINIITFSLFGIDKRRAIKNKWRISEATLLISSLIGGVIGGFLGMSIFHHKIKKIKFKILMPIILMLYIFLIFVLKTKI